MDQPRLDSRGSCTEGLTGECGWGGACRIHRAARAQPPTPRGTSQSAWHPRSKGQWLLGAALGPRCPRAGGRPARGVGPASHEVPIKAQARKERCRRAGIMASAARRPPHTPASPATALPPVTRPESTCNGNRASASQLILRWRLGPGSQLLPTEPSRVVACPAGGHGRFCRGRSPHGSTCHSPGILPTAVGG